LESPTLQNIDIDANGIYTLVIDDGLCFSAPASTTINIGIIPEQADIEIVGIPCLGADISIEVTVAEPGTYTYVWTTPQGTITTTEPILLLEDISNIDNGQYTIQIEVDGCISVASDPASLTVLSGIASPLIMGTDKVCLGESIELSATEIMGANYLWIGPAGAIQESSNVLIVPNADLSDQGDYSVSIQLDGCESQLSSNFNVEVVEIVDAPSFVEQEISICFMAGDMIEICVNDNLLPGEEIQLYNEESMQLLLTSNDQCFELPLSSMNPTDTLELLVTKSFDGCVSAFSLPLDLILYESPNQFAQFIEDEKSICGKDNIELILDEGAEFASQWESNDPTAELTVTEEGIILDNISEDMFQLYITSSFGECIAYATDTLDVVIIREALAMSDQATTAFAELVEIDVLANDDYLDNIVFGLVSEPENGTAEFVNDLLEYTPDRDFVGEDIFEYEICLEDCPEICSVATVSITVGDLEDCFVGNLITPNGDGINDALTIPCLSSGNYEGNEIIIFNEWGSEVYRASPYLNDWQGTFNGDPLPTGTYFYQLDFGGVKPASSGFIVIER